MFAQNIGKIGIPLHTPVLPDKSGVHGGINCTDMSSNWFVLVKLVARVVYSLKL